jgi:hypothetical protein
LRITKIEALPEGFSVGRDLYVDGTDITALPKGLRVGGSLDLCGTKITALPEGLSVGSDLYLSGMNITALPKGLTVGGGRAGIAIFSCPIHVNLVAPLYPGFRAMQKHTDEGFRVALCRRVTGNGRERSCSVV